MVSGASWSCSAATTTSGVPESFAPTAARIAFVVTGRQVNWNTAHKGIAERIAGVGLGIDRLAMILAGCTDISDVIPG